MKLPHALITLLVVAFVSATALGQTPEKPKLPQVLILGDFVATQYTNEVSKELKGKAEITTPRWEADEIGCSSTLLLHLDRQLGYLDQSGKLLPEDQRPHWNVIHLNVGLGDLIHCVPNLISTRVLPIDQGGVVNTSSEIYEANLRKIVERLKKTGAKLIWASTTPIRASRSNVFELGSEITYNEIAKRVMEENGVIINDMYHHTKAVMNMDKPASHGADPFSFDRKPIHPPVVEIISTALDL